MALLPRLSTRIAHKKLLRKVVAIRRKGLSCAEELGIELITETEG